MKHIGQYFFIHGHNRNKPNLLPYGCVNIYSNSNELFQHEVFVYTLN